MSKYCFATILFYLEISNGISEKNNVCKGICDYTSIDNNENCWYNPDVGSSPEQIIVRRGFPFESHQITTEDNYLKILYRIPHNNTHSNMLRQPILLHGGISGGSSSFFALGNRSLPFFLVNNGFDVWLSNRRGFLSGKGHRVYKREDKEFWDFSFHELGYYDIKAEVNFITNKTLSEKKIILLGYSLGTTETYIYAMLRKKHAKKHIAGIISLSPIAFMTRSGSVIAKIAPYSHLLENFLKEHNIYALFGERNDRVEDVNRFTFDNLILAKSFITLIAGRSSSQIDPADFPVYLGGQRSPVSVKTLIHFAQEVNAGGNFQFYDHGFIKNVKLYKSGKPPSYNISLIRVPVHLFYAEADLLSDKMDVFKLYDKLTVKNKSLTCIPQDKRIKFNHVDFILAKDVKKLLYGPLLKTIKENLSQ